VTGSITADLTEIAEVVHRAALTGQSLCIRGGGSKGFLGRDLNHLKVLDIKGLTGIVDYDPSELVLQVRSGTPLQEIKLLLASENQMLAFDPPGFVDATIGGTISTGLSGSRRPYAGAARDFVLGIDVINGMGEHLSFGGQVIKNVAGYDASRLMVGSMGCLGIVTEVSLKVLPRPEVEETRAISVSASVALDSMLQLSSHSQLVSATAFYQDRLYARFSGAEKSVKSEVDSFGGETVDPGWWHSIDTLTLFDAASELWRVSGAPNCRSFLAEAVLIDWGGGQRWLVNPAKDPRPESSSDDHATLIKGNSTEEKYQPLTASVERIHQGLKKQFDPKGILNPHKMYASF